MCPFTGVPLCEPIQPNHVKVSKCLRVCVCELNDSPFLMVGVLVASPKRNGLANKDLCTSRARLQMGLAFLLRLPPFLGGFQ